MNRLPNKTATIRLRCEPRFKQEIRQVALLKNLSDADIVRIACNDYIQRFKAMPMQATGI